ncbi:hypothetical protein SAMN05660337_3253 [Maridesulfovibrio ferrireducens]|uniref:Uncharacterized protein n=1 Tax=Maridesulfovibrio ferrireducens TaxID=246191 RepID=A0A1G9L420_9BACT|nr:hypothetical protein [Maridesulfovibrio ferrireducens]SDL56503.1 hypothetical protein SAMN05660337_3253 [Maridesulfovibrio ferrireducens]
MSADNGPPWPGFVDALSTVLMMMVFFTLLMVLVVGTLSYIVALKEVTPNASASTEQVETMVAASQDLASPESSSAMTALQDTLNEAVVLKKEDLMPTPAQPEVTIEQIEQEKAVLQARLVKAEAAAKKVRQVVNDPVTEKKLQQALARIAVLESSSGGIEREIDAEETPQNTPFVTKLVKGIDSKNRIIILYNQLTSTLEDSTRTELLSWIAKNKAAIMQKGLQLTATLNHNGVSSSMSNSVSYKRLYGLIKVVNQDGKIPKAKITFRALGDGVPGTNQVVINLGKK